MIISKQDINRRIQDLKEYAKINGYKVVYREKKTNYGDFTFFVYSKKGGRYLVGYDGDWNGEGMWSWKDCYLATVKYIDNNIWKI